MNQKGQNVVELTVLVAASMIALLLIFMIYSEQFGAVTSFNDYHTARASVRKVVDAANTVYYSGPGSEIKILVEIPDSVVLEESGIDGKTVYLHMVDGSDIIDVADVNIFGKWQDDSKYYMIIRYDGNAVYQIERAHEVVGGTAFILKGTSITDNDTNFSVTNTFDKTLHFELDMYYEQGSPGIEVQFYEEGQSGAKGDHIDFNLPVGETRVIYFWIQGPSAVCHSNSTGYFDVTVTGEDYIYIGREIISVEYDLDSCND